MIHSVFGRRGKAFLRFLIVTLFGVILPLAVLAVGVYGARQLMDTAPRAERNASGQKEEQARLVEAITLESGVERVTVEAMGTVQAARRVTLQPEVGGRVLTVNSDLVPGGIVEQGDVIAEIDETDYRLALLQREAELAQAESDLEIEMGQQRIAKREFEVLGEDIPEEESRLVLREPQLAKAKANIEAARAALESAKVDIERTTIVAPFNALVLEESIETGAIIGTQTAIAELAGIDEYWLEVALPVDHLRWLTVPRAPGERGSSVRIYDEAAWGPGQFRTGHIVRFSGDVDTESRMTRVIVAIEDPLSLREENEQEPIVLLNRFVEAAIEGHALENVIAIERKYLRENDTIWVMDDEDRLDIRTVEVAWRGKEVVYIRAGANSGDRLVTTTLTSPVHGMKLRVPVPVQETQQPESIAYAGNESEEVVADE